MFARVASIFMFLFFALPLLAAATAVPRTDPTGQCNTGTIQCCNSVQSVNYLLLNYAFHRELNAIQASNPVVGLLAGLLGIVLGPITGQVGCKFNK